MSKKLKITQIKSIIDRPKTQKLTMESLGLKKLNYSVIHNDIPQIKGMIKKVAHLIKVEEIEG